MMVRVEVRQHWATACLLCHMPRSISRDKIIPRGQCGPLCFLFVFIFVVFVLEINSSGQPRRAGQAIYNCRSCTDIYNLDSRTG